MERTNAVMIHDAWGRMFLHLNQAHMGLEDELMRKWSSLGNEITFASTSTIYNHFKGRLSRKRIEEVLSTIPTYSKYKEKRKPIVHNPIFVYYKHQIWGIDLMYMQK